MMPKSSMAESPREKNMSSPCSHTFCPLSITVTLPVGGSFMIGERCLISGNWSWMNWGNTKKPSLRIFNNLKDTNPEDYLTLLCNSRFSVGKLWEQLWELSVNSLSLSLCLFSCLFCCFFSSTKLFTTCVFPLSLASDMGGGKFSVICHW